MTAVGPSRRLLRLHNVVVVRASGPKIYESLP